MKQNVKMETFIYVPQMEIGILSTSAENKTLPMVVHLQKQF